VVVRPLRNERLDREAAERRRRLGMEPVPRERAVAALFRLLRRNESIALLCDLDQKRGPVFADFFGVPAATVATPALLAYRTGKPILCVGSFASDEPLRYDAEFAPPLVARSDVPAEAETRRLTQAMNDALERFVRRAPGQWNWIHPRWRTRPENAVAPRARADA
jgi:KDO2-lipid IV(A) lauroyltransferase